MVAGAAGALDGPVNTKDGPALAPLLAALEPVLPALPLALAPGADPAACFPAGGTGGAATTGTEKPRVVLPAAAAAAATLLLASRPYLVAVAKAVAAAAAVAAGWSGNGFTPITGAPVNTKAGLEAKDPGNDAAAGGMVPADAGKYRGWGEARRRKGCGVARTLSSIVEDIAASQHVQQHRSMHSSIAACTSITA